MTLTDTGPLVALVDSGESAHSRCVAALAVVSPPLITSWPALTEAMYLLEQAMGWRAQDALWRLVAGGNLLVECPDAGVVERMRQLMQKYRDLPMGLADASLVALAESRNLRMVFTLDSHFGVYRLHDRIPFTIVPAPLPRDGA